MSRTPDVSWIVRPAKSEDLEPALDVLEKVAEERLYIGTEPPLDRVRRLRKWQSVLEHPKETMFVAVADGVVVGSADLGWAGASELGMAILREWRGRGIGSALLRACIDWAEANDIVKMELQVWPHNEAAIALYEKFGFEREGYLKRHYRRRNGEIWDCIIMGLQLPR